MLLKPTDSDAGGSGKKPEEWQEWEQDYLNWRQSFRRNSVPRINDPRNLFAGPGVPTKDAGEGYEPQPGVNYHYIQPYDPPQKDQQPMTIPGATEMSLDSFGGVGGALSGLFNQLRFLNSDDPVDKYRTFTGDSYLDIPVGMLYQSMKAEIPYPFSLFFLDFNDLKSYPPGSIIRGDINTAPPEFYFSDVGEMHMQTIFNVAQQDMEEAKRLAQLTSFGATGFQGTQDFAVAPETTAAAQQKAQTQGMGVSKPSDASDTSTVNKNMFYQDQGQTNSPAVQSNQNMFSTE